MVLNYQPGLKQNARLLRKRMTDSERVLWSRLRRKQLFSIQFYRQKPIGQYVVDFYAPKAKLVIEVDGSQHAQGTLADKDELRDQYLASVGQRVVRFNSREVLKNTDAVIEVIHNLIAKQLKE